MFKDIAKIQGCSRIFKESGHHVHNNHQNKMSEVERVMDNTEREVEGVNNSNGGGTVPNPVAYPALGS